MKITTILIENCEYDFIPCTAVAVSAGDTEPQAAVYVHQRGGDGMVFFGCGVPEDEEEALDLFQECGESDSETLETVKIDGLPLSEYASGAL